MTIKNLRKYKHWNKCRAVGPVFVSVKHLRQHRLLDARGNKISKWSLAHAESITRTQDGLRDVRNTCPMAFDVVIFPFLVRLRPHRRPIVSVTTNPMKMSQNNESTIQFQRGSQNEKWWTKYDVLGRFKIAIGMAEQGAAAHMALLQRQRCPLYDGYQQEKAKTVQNCPKLKPFAREQQWCRVISHNSPSSSCPIQTI